MQAKTFSRAALIAWMMQAFIVFSGAAVRLTEAGLGCEDWPTCNEDRFLPEWQLHGLIEFGNRVISGFVAVSAVAVVVAAYRRTPRRADLITYAWLVMAGTATQVVLGGITVLLDLHPIVVGVHFLISMGLLVVSQSLWFRSRLDDVQRRSDPDVSHPAQSLIRLQLGLSSVVLFTGTVVTGTGPNSGDSRADRLGFELETVARIHSLSVWLTLAVLVWLAIRLSRIASGSAQPAGPALAPVGPFRDPFTIIRWMLGVVMIQGAIGYTQFALGVPPLLVELHIVGAVAVWTLALHLMMSAGQVVGVGSEYAGRSETVADLV